MAAAALQPARLILHTPAVLWAALPFTSLTSVLFTHRPAGVMPEGDPSNQYTRSVDIFAYGLLMLELVSGRKVDRSGETDWQQRLAGVPDEAARAFIARCCAPSEQRAGAAELLEDAFLQVGGR